MAKKKKKAIERGEFETRHWSFVAEHQEHGRSTIEIVCPFCCKRVTAYKWSMAGCGKRCTCGAMHYRDGDSQMIKRETT